MIKPKLAVVLTALLFPWPALAADPIYFLWDVGKERDQADRGDVIMNLAERCNSSKIAVNYPGLLDKQELPDISVPRPEDTKAKFNAFQLDIPDQRFFQFVWVFDSFKGTEKTVFILLPEAHYEPTPDSGLYHSVLHFTRSYFSVGLINELRKNPKASILNLREGVIGGDWQLKDLHFKETEPLPKVSEMAEQMIPTTFLAIGNVFKDAPDVYTSYLEKAGLVYADLLLTLGSFDGHQSFDETMTEVKKFYRAELDLKDVHEEFDSLQKMNPQQLAILKDLICSLRGNEMANTAITLALQKSADIVFLAYGASHHSEITQKLREKNFSYLAILGHLPKDLH